MNSFYYSTILEYLNFALGIVKIDFQIKTYTVTFFDSRFDCLLKGSNKDITVQPFFPAYLIYDHLEF